MTSYKGLRVPARRSTSDIDLSRQETACLNTDASECGPLGCFECLFWNKNLKNFLEWEKDQTKEVTG